MEEFELEPGETVISVVRKHWIVFFGWLIPCALLAWLPTFVPHLLGFIESYGKTSTDFASFLTLDNPLFRLFLGMWWLILWIGVFNRFTQYYLNHWVITSQRIVEIRQFGFFDRKVSSFLLSRVQDITTTVDGIFADLFGYGCVQVETAGDASKHFAMDGVADPQAMRDLIMREIALLNKGDKSGV